MYANPHAEHLRSPSQSSLYRQAYKYLQQRLRLDFTITKLAALRFRLFLTALPFSLGGGFPSACRLSNDPLSIDRTEYCSSEFSSRARAENRRDSMCASGRDGGPHTSAPTKEEFALKSPELRVLWKSCTHYGALRTA